MTKFDANGNAIFTYSEEVAGWFYDVVMNDGTQYGLVVTENGSQFACHADYGSSAAVAWFEIA